MKKIKFILIVSVFSLIYLAGLYQNVSAAPAYNSEQNFKQPSGESFKASLNGDEWINWVTSSDDDALMKDKDGYWKYAEVSNNKLKPGNIKYKINARPKTALKKKDVLNSIKQKKIIKPENSSKPTKSSKSPSVMTSSTDKASSPIEYGIQAASAPVKTRNIILLLVEFSNYSIKYSEADWSNRIFAAGGSTVNSYYNEASGGRFQFSPAAESYGSPNNGVIKVKLNYLHPNTAGNTGSANQKIVSDAVATADPYINYAAFDSNKDGTVTDEELLIITVVAGNEASCGGASPSVWAHKWGFTAYSKYDGISFSSWKGYTQLGELQYSNMATIGTLCHELGHDLGLPDLYDYDGSSLGVGIHSIMASGSWGRASGASDCPPGSSPTHMDAWCKAYIGFVNPQVLDSAGTYTVNSFDTGSYNVLKIPTSNPKEYFLIENRQFKGFDKALSPLNFNPACVSGGIAIWHIDESPYSGSFYGCNDNELHKMVAIEEANYGKLGYSQLDKRLSGSYDHYYYIGSNTVFSPTTAPGSNLYSGAKSNITVTVKSPCSSSMTVTIAKPMTLSPKGAIEAPQSGAAVRKTCSVRGWFLDTDEVQKIQIFVDGSLKGQADYGSTRNDIDSQYPQYDNPDCGFEYVLDVSGLTDGTHTLTVKETSKAGTVTALPSISIVVENYAKLTITYSLSETANVTVQIADSDGKLVKTIVDSVEKSAGSNSAKWDGRNSSGQLVEDGIYTYKVTAVNQAGLSAKPLTGTFTVERVPHVVSISADPDPFTPDGTKKATFRYTLSKAAKVSASIIGADSSSVISIPLSGNVGENTFEWDGKDKNSSVVEDGVYKFTLNVMDSQGNIISGSTASIRVDKTLPVISSSNINSNPFAPTGSNTAQISYYISEKAYVTVKVLKNDGSLVKVLSGNVLKASGLNFAEWDGKDSSGAIVPNGTYKYTIDATDLASLTALPVSRSFTVGPGSAAGLYISSPSASPNPFEPNGSNTTAISFDLSDNASVSVNIYDSNKNLVRNLAENQACSKGKNTIAWDGKNNNSSVVKGSNYTYEINASGLDGTLAKPVSGIITVKSTTTGDDTGGGTGGDTGGGTGNGGQLSISSVSDSPDPFSPNGSNKAAVKFTLSKSASVSIKIYDKNSLLIKTITISSGVYGSNAAYWDGKNDKGVIVSDGVYSYTIDAVDASGYKASQVKGTITVDGTPPSIYNHRAEPPVISP